MNNKGFSLLEVLIGLVILAIGLLAIAGMQITAIKGNYFSKSVTEATVLAQDKLEELKNLPYDHASNAPGSSSEPKYVSGTTFTRQVVVAEDAGNSIKTITVTVSWTDGGNRSISLSTIRAM